MFFTTLWKYKYSDPNCLEAFRASRKGFLDYNTNKLGHILNAFMFYICNIFNFLSMLNSEWELKTKNCPLTHSNFKSTGLKDD